MYASWHYRAPALQKPVTLGEFEAAQQEKELSEREKIGREIIQDLVASGEILGWFAANWIGDEFFIIDVDHKTTADLYLERDPRLQDPDDLDSIEDLDDLFGYDGWGYNDQYAACVECGSLIETVPQSPVWTCDFWKDADEDVVYCGDCVRKDPSDYIEDLEYRIYESGEPQLILCVEPEDHGWVPVIEGLEHGYHPWQNDDPRSLVSWALARDLLPVFTMTQGQFDQRFDLYLKRGQPDEAGDFRKLDKHEVERIRAALLEDPDATSPRLRREFREYPTPAQKLQERLKNAPLPGPGEAVIIVL